jgi:fermentation-respiration switch protein FrsA (DUF1100 family)
VAVDLASRRPHRALVLVRTFTSVPDVAQAQFSVVSVRPLVSNRFDNLGKIGRCRRPVFIAHGDADRLIPFAQGERLKAACGARSQFFSLKGMGHNDPLPGGFYQALRDFLKEQVPIPAAGKR